MFNHDPISTEHTERGILRAFVCTQTAVQRVATDLRVNAGKIQLRIGDPADFRDGLVPATEQYTSEEAEHLARILLDLAAKARADAQ